MVRVMLPVEVSSFVAARVAGFPAEAPEPLRWQSTYVAEFGALPLYLGWTETIGIRPDGEIIRWSTEGEFAGARPLDDRDWVLPALVDGVARYPELRPLLPERRAEAVDCPCRAYPLFASGKVICGQCDGLGWLPRPDVCLAD
jgi:hypothetical protein